MKQQVTVLFVIIVMIMSPLYVVSSIAPHGVSISMDSQMSPECIPESEGLGPQKRPESRGDWELDMMAFAPTSSQEDGLYFVCRRGVSAVAYFGISVVHYVVDDIIFTLEFPGSSQVAPEGEKPTGSVTNYFYGSDSSQWKTGLRDCAALRYNEIYPGIDLVYRLQDSGFKYEFVVSPNADPEPIRLRYSDANHINVGDDWIGVIRDGQQILDTQLTVFQGTTVHTEIDCVFSVDASDTIRFTLGEYDHSQVLVIDPTIIAYSTLLGGTDYDHSYDIKAEYGYIYITGKTVSSDFPTVNAYNSTFGTNYDCFITKLAPDGQSLVYSTFLGGNGSDCGTALSVWHGFIWLTGYTESPDFPTINGYDMTYNGNRDCFVAFLHSDGQSLVWSTFVGGSGEDSSSGIGCWLGHCFITGQTSSSDFPTSTLALDTTLNGTIDCFVTCVHSEGTSLAYSTYLGGIGDDWGEDISVDQYYAYVTGFTESSDFPTVNAYDSTFNGPSDCFVAKVSTAGELLVFSTFLGGASGDSGHGIAAYNGHAYVTGATQSSDFPTVNAYDSSYNGGNDGFVTKFAPDGQSLVYSTLIGGNTTDVGWDIAVENHYAYITGYTESHDYPLLDPYDSTLHGFSDCIVTGLATDGRSLVYSTYVGGMDMETSYGIALENGSIYITGETASPDYPTFLAWDSTWNGGYDCFVSMLSVDSDSDGLSDWEEYGYGTDPFCIDSDIDNFIDTYEVLYGSDPLDPMSYPAMPQAWYDAIYEDLDGNATLIQNLILWSNGNATRLQTVMQQLDANATLLQQVIGWLDGNHTAIENLFTYLDGNATQLMLTVNALDANSTLIQNLLTWSAGNATLLQNVIEQVGTMEPTDLSQVIAWLDGNHTAIQTLFTYVAGNASLLLNVVYQLGENATRLELIAALATQNTAWLQALNASVIGDINEIRAILNELGVTVGDTDYDGLDDLDEMAYGTDIQCIDTDCDNLNDAYEVKIGTDPTDDDSDNDTYYDGAEVLAGTDPLDDQEYPGSGGTTTPLPTTDQPTGLVAIILIGVGGCAGLVVVLLVLKRRTVSSGSS